MVLFFFLLTIILTVRYLLWFSKTFLVFFSGFVKNVIDILMVCILNFLIALSVRSQEVKSVKIRFGFRENKTQLCKWWKLHSSLICNGGKCTQDILTLPVAGKHIPRIHAQLWPSILYMLTDSAIRQPNNHTAEFCELLGSLSF